jgi:hypothetical protein
MAPPTPTARKHRPHTQYGLRHPMRTTGNHLSCQVPALAARRARHHHQRSPPRPARRLPLRGNNHPQRRPELHPMAGTRRYRGPAEDPIPHRPHHPAHLHKAASRTDQNRCRSPPHRLIHQDRRTDPAALRHPRLQNLRTHPRRRGGNARTDNHQDRKAPRSDTPSPTSPVPSTPRRPRKPPDDEPRLHMALPRNQCRTTHHRTNAHEPTTQPRHRHHGRQKRCTARSHQRDRPHIAGRSTRLHTQDHEHPRHTRGNTDGHLPGDQTSTPTAEITPAIEHNTTKLDITDIQ